jgi:hypothetical protein
LAAFEELKSLVQLVENIKDKGLIDKLAAVDIQYDRFDNIFKSTKYLEDITEDVIYAALSHAIR